MSEINTLSDRPTIIPGRYIVFLKNYVDQTIHQNHVKSVQTICAERCLRPTDADSPDDFVRHTFELPGLRGYSGVFDEETLRDIENNSVVSHVEPDQYVYPIAVTQENVPSWGLARLSHSGPLASDQASKNYVYNQENDGEGTTAYVIDTGIYTEHEDFEGRARWGTVIPLNATRKDFDGHGTHVAGTIGSKTYGVAKKANLVAVKIFPDGANQGGSMSDIIKGLEWAVNDAISRGDIHKCVANMSVGGGKMQAVNSAISAAVRAGLTVCVAAGNESRDAANTSPASAPDAITVGSTDRSDAFSSYSNFGRILDVLAPGRAIVSCSIKGPNQSVALSGTSMATPHVTGLACSILSDGTVNTPIGVIQKMLKIGEKGAITGELRSTPNVLVRQVISGSATPPTAGDDDDEWLSGFSTKKSPFQGQGY